jgi:hypothetical protein
MAAGVIWIAYEAQEPDSYYASGDVTRWEHASNAGSAPVVIGGSIVASVISLVFLIRRRLDPTVAIAATAVYLVSWFAAWVALAGGH